MPSLLGVCLFLIPIDSPRGPTVLIGLIGYSILEVVQQWLPYVVTATLSLSALGSLVSRVLEPAFIHNNKLLRSLLDTSLFWICVRIIAAVIAIMTLGKIGPEWLWGTETGAVVLYDLLSVLFIFFLLAGLFLPFLLDYGLVELVGVFLHRILKPLYKIPGNSGVDIIASLLGDGTVGTLITARQYENGYYTAREAAVIASTFSIVSISFCVVVVNFVGLSHMFPYFYLTVITTCLIIALILPRIWPLRSIPDTYHHGASYTSEADPLNAPRGLFKGFLMAVNKAEKAPSLSLILKKGLTNALDIWFVFMPIIMTIATLGLIIGQETSLFYWLGAPVVPILELFGLPEAEKAAPAVLLGFADMFLPAAFCAKIESEITRFVISALSIAQLIYMSEVGVLIMRSAIPLNFLQLLTLFLIRTALALPIIVLFAKYYFG
ncbi:YjiH family protein [Sansalvadorimonas verongulae]|uniref:YjiH family protein n=1 Tax=Sansalvadorimonas verongulae TaxID=2172824 RepID=UPI0012BD2F20|nr:YjiH family protein [Sansalvadorimonas verongulae]MTI13325.1 YjiH family protein [Sansalvadorimonas verongulae]